ncbi:MAG: hypothetical protein FJ144_04595 [Deltaproteobacteria bacterium]|nr:hypothetical protein [Deltaproteobacteria bacterium]
MVARTLVVIALTLTFAPALAAARSRCDEDGAHAAALAAAEDEVRERCDCAAATTHANHVDCARAIARELAFAGELPRACAGRVRQFARRSTCGRDDVVACCLEGRKGKWRGAVRAAGEGCVAPTEGSACEAPSRYLKDCSSGDACTPSECGDGVVDPPEECEPPFSFTCGGACRRRCGDGVVEALFSEECEPPGTATCDDACLFIHTCGNGVIEPGEECDGQAACGPACAFPRVACCDFGDWCIGSTVYDDFSAYFNVFKPCFLALGGQGSFGVCEGSPCPEAPERCRIGSCSDHAIDPLPLCCNQAAGGCRDAIVTTAGGIGGFGCGSFPPPTEGDIDRLVLGTCGDEGRCVPVE